MGNRLTKIVTRTGDQGTTGLADGSRVAKDHPRIEAIGDLDELNCALGLLLILGLPDDIRSDLEAVQQTLFDIGGELSIPGQTTLTDEPAARLERRIEAYNADLPPLREFILPGGGEAAARCHVARAVCRRAERRIVALSHEAEVSPHALVYLNRLSDLLFVTSRVLVRRENGREVYWRSERLRQPDK
jgi:cob(I)alamin adenosyltransferase